MEEKIAELQKQIDDSLAKSAAGNAGRWSDLMKNPGRKAIIIGVVLASLVHISGAYAIMAYAGTIFQGSGSIFKTNESALLVAVVQFIGTSMLPLLVERVGRKVK